MSVILRYNRKGEEGAGSSYVPRYTCKIVLIGSDT